MMKKVLIKTIILLLTLTAMLLMSCEEQQIAHQKEEVDSLMNAAYQSRNYELILSLADQHQQDGTISAMKACYWRGYAYSRQRKMRMAEIEWKNAVAQKVTSGEDMKFYGQSASHLAGLLYLKLDYGEAIRVALTAIDLMRENGYTMNNHFSNLLTFVGSCQLKLGHLQEAANNFARTWLHYQQVMEAYHDQESYTGSIVGLVTIVDAYIQTAHYQEASEWADRLESMLQLRSHYPDVKEDYIDKQWARLYLYRACALEGLGNKAEAEKAYKKALATQYVQTAEGKMEANNYLMTAHRWSEAADNFQVLEAQMVSYDVGMSIENIHAFLLPKFLANAEAHRTDTAIALGIRLCHALDSAINRENRNEAAELATIFEIQQKEAELMEQRNRLSDQRLLMVCTTLSLIVLGLGLFIFFRHRAAVKLETAYYDLERANIRVEESSRMKSDFIQQISHEIRTPLNILSGFTQLLTMPGSTYDEATLQDINQKIVENTDRITSLVNKMLELSEAKNHNVIECSDNVAAVEVAAEAVNASGITEATHLTFDMVVSPEAEQAMLQTNRTAVIRALSLVLDNARKFTAPAEARQREKPTDHQQKVVLRMTVVSGRLFFSVEDTGIGIPHKEAERIFDEFVQLDEYYDGTGIGLTVARSLARRIGGDIMLDTAYIGGSRFVMTLPVCS
jgi:signal transduction histidine kinase